jgi:adenosylcobinamide-GDP ribazoletransferase
VIATVATLVVPFVVAGVAAVPALLVAGLVTLAAARLFRRRLGGITGDTLGATIVIAEVCVIAAVLAWP